jgi:hypothetical protein
MQVLGGSNILRTWTKTIGSFVCEFLVCSWEDRSICSTGKWSLYNLNFKAKISISGKLFCFSKSSIPCWTFYLFSIHSITCPSPYKSCRWILCFSVTKTSNRDKSQGRKAFQLSRIPVKNLILTFSLLDMSLKFTSLTEQLCNRQQSPWATEKNLI